MATDIFIHTVDDFNPNEGNIEFRGATFNGSSGFGTVIIMYDKSSINIQTHLLFAPFGYNDGQGQIYEAKPSIQFNLYEDNDKDVKLISSLRVLEDIIVQTAFERRIEWQLFSSQKKARDATIEEVREKFNSIIKPGKGEYPPTLKVGFLNGRDGKISTLVVDESGDPIEVNSITLPRRCRGICNLQAKTIWISKDGKFGIKFNLQRLQVTPPTQREDNSRPTGRKTTSLMTNVVSKYDNDDDDDDKDKPALPTGKCVMRDDDDDD
jgi:hypothetical protein